MTGSSSRRVRVGDGELDVDELGAAEEAHKSEVVSRDVAPVDPVGDAAHPDAEIPAIDDEGDAQINGHAAAMRRGVPLAAQRESSAGRA